MERSSFEIIKNEHTIKERGIILLKPVDINECITMINLAYISITNIKNDPILELIKSGIMPYHPEINISGKHLQNLYLLLAKGLPHR